MISGSVFADVTDVTSEHDMAAFPATDGVLDPLFGTHVGERNRHRKYTEGPIEVDYDVWSNDYQFLLFKDEVSRTLTKMFPPNVTKDGKVFGNGVRTNFYGMRHVNGFPMINATYPLTSNKYLREKSNLANSFTEDWHRVAFRALIKLFFSRLEPQRLKIRKGSSTVIPWFTKNMLLKKEQASYSLGVAKKAAHLIMRDDYESAFKSYKIGGAYFIVYRRQSTDGINYTDGRWVSKDRAVADQAFAVSGGRKGTFLPASKSLEGVDFRVPEGFFRERNRTAKGGPFGLGACLMPIAQSVRAHLYSDYGYTYHHTTRQAIEDDLREWSFVIASDVSNHDIYWPTFLISETISVLSEMGFEDWWLALYSLKSRLPDFVTGVGPDKENVMLGDWRHPSNSGGLPSGNPFTDIEGTYGMTWVYMLMQIEHTWPDAKRHFRDESSAMAFIDRYLKGGYPIKLKDKSDDAFLGWSDPVFLPAAKTLHDKMVAGEQVSPYMDISYEHGGAFLGNILLYPESDRSGTKPIMIGNIQSLLTNAFSPEYGVQSAVKERIGVKRPYPGLAWGSYSQVYGSCPIYADVLDIVDRTWNKVYGESWKVRKQKQYDYDVKKLNHDLRNYAHIGISNLSPIDLEVLADPSKLEYKYDEKDVSQEILDLLFQGLKLEEVEPYFRSVFK